MKILISGINGKMGKEIYSQAKLANIAVACGIDTSTIGEFDCPVYKKFGDFNFLCDAIVDFSSPSLLPDLLNFASTTATPIVIGTTGYSNEDLIKIRNASEKTAIFKSDNFSLGIYTLIKLAKQAVSMLDGYDIELIEYHHNNKADSPSGTAKAIASAICETSKSDKHLCYNRHGNCKRAKSEIGIHSVRGGGIVGTHEVLLLGDDDYITIKHDAINKSVFAKGALKAAKYLIGKPNGLYNMNDLVIQSK